MIYKQEAKFIKKNKTPVGITKLVEKVALGQSIIEANVTPQISVLERVCWFSLTEY